ncbi:MAG: hypothetical protein M0P49_04495 [Bacilli bacterium]|nr:hypothetical protein [Bacilli bacterium]
MTTSILNPFFDRTYFTAPINYIISSYIREYDISKANANVLFMKGAISKDQYNHLLSLDSESRYISVGLLQKDNPDISTCLKEGIKEMRYLFLTSNNLTESDILSIKNDAIFVLSKIPMITKFGIVEFVNKNIYTSFYKLGGGKIEIYYLYDMVNNIEHIDIKGIKDWKVLLHKDYFLEFLLVLFNSAQIESLKDTIDILITFYESYLKLELDIGYYRQFDAESLFSIKRLGISSVYKADFLSEETKDYLDISYNLNILRELVGIFSTIQDKKKR